MGKKSKMSQEEEEKLQKELSNEKQPDHEGDRGEAKSSGKKPDEEEEEKVEEGAKKVKKGKGKKDMVTLNLDSTNINRFISQVSQKNYAEANKYLRAALEDKMKSRIAQTQHKLGF